MIFLDRFCHGILLLSLFCILIPSYYVTDARRYDKCTTHDGHQGVCVVKRYCRGATDHPLLPCEGDDENHCCPIPTTLRSAPPPPPPPRAHQDPPRSLDRDHRAEDEPQYNERPRVQEEPRYNERPRVDDTTRNHGVPSGREEPRYNERPRVDDTTRNHEVPSGREEPRYNERPRADDTTRNHGVPSGREEPRYNESPRADDTTRNHEVSNGREEPRFNERPRADDTTRNHEVHSGREEPPYNGRPRVEDDKPHNGRSEVHRSRDEPQYSERPRVGDDGRDSRRPELPRGGEEPRYNERPRVEDDRRNSRRPEKPRGREEPHYNDRPGVEEDGGNSRRPEPPRGREEPRYNDRPGVEDDGRNSRRPEPPRGRDEPRYNDRPGVEDDGRSSRRPEPPRDREEPHYNDRPRVEDDGRDRRIVNVPRVREDPWYEERPRTEDDEKDRRRPVRPKDVLDERDDRLNKTPPPSDRRSPTWAQRPKDPGRPRDVVSEKEKTRPDKSHGNPSPSDHRTRDDGSGSRRPPERRPSDDRYYPNRDPGRTQGRNHTSDSSSKAPIRFPEHPEPPISRPKVPGCGVKPYELFIAGGSESAEHEWPWMTAIFRRHPDSRPKTFLCGGSLVNTKYVLTAAHCFVNNYVVLPASAFVVRLGSHFLDSGEEYTVSDLVIHHNHSGSDFFNDIALVRLASAVAVTDKIAPVCLPDPALLREDLVGRVATVAGWGDTSFRASGARILQHVSVPIVSGEECFAAYSRVRGAAFLARGSDHVICAGLREGGKDACLGDSGGPLMLKLADDRWVVVGIVSLGYKCAEPGYPGVYTRVTHYMAWIAANMKRH